MSALRFRYQTLEFGDTDIHVRTLRDRQQFDDPDQTAEKLGVPPSSWPLFGVVWPSSEVLAQQMQGFDIDGRRILEVGCGIALASLMLNQRMADITATDYHPSVEGFLATNVGLNSGRAIPFVRTGWDDALSQLGLFDVIIGSDLLYERDHVDLLAGFIDQHAEERCEVILVDPGRGESGRFSKKMATLGYTHNRYVPEHTDQLSQPFQGTVLRYLR